MLHHRIRSASNNNRDPYFNYTTLLLSGEGSNGGQNNTFVDGSSNAFSVTRYGNTTQGTFSPFGYNWGVSFDGSGDYLTGSSNSAFAINTTEDWTIECFVNFGALNYGAFFQATNNINSSSGQIWFGYYTGGLTVSQHGSGTYMVNYAWTPSIGRWYHVAATRTSGTTRLFIDGSLVATSTIQNGVSFTQNGFAIGVLTTPEYLNGTISNLRFVKGTSLYSSAFTPPSTNLTAITNTILLTCQSNRFLDNSSNAFTITPYGNAAVTNFAPFAPLAEYSASRNGGSLTCYGGTLTSASNAAFAFGTGDFTLECWTYPLQENYSWLFDFRRGTHDQPRPALYGQAGLLSYYVSADTRISGAALTQRAWNHVAVSRVSGTTRLFINGAQTGSNYSDSTNYEQSEFKFNGYTEGSSLSGTQIVSGVRVVKGTGLYSSNFSVPTTAPTAISGTSILLNFTNASIIDSTGKNNVETAGNAQIGTAEKKFGVSSLKFDGTGDSLKLPANSVLNFGTGDFTVEFWVNTISTSSGTQFFNLNTDFLFIIGTNGSNYLEYFANSSTRIDSNTTITNNIWNHIACVRSNGITKLFLNGVQVGNSYTDSGNYYCSNGCIIGKRNESDLSANGYIDDLRVTRGIARYNSTFTPPTKSLPTK